MTHRIYFYRSDWKSIDQTTSLFRYLFDCVLNLLLTAVNGFVFPHLGAAAVALSGLISATRITKTRLMDNKYLFYGAGAVSLQQD